MVKQAPVKESLVNMEERRVIALERLCFYTSSICKSWPDKDRWKNTSNEVELIAMHPEHKVKIVLGGKIRRRHGCVQVELMIICSTVCGERESKRK